LLPRTEKQNKDYKNRDNDPKGPWKATPLHARSGSETGRYKVTFENGISNCGLFELALAILALYSVLILQTSSKACFSVLKSIPN